MSKEGSRTDRNNEVIMPSCPPPGEVPDLQSALSAHWQHVTVLVVEDHSTYRALLGWYLGALGLGFELFSDGRSALAAIVSRPFDLVITDCQMPLMDGYRMTRAIRLRERINGLARMPVIALTANLTLHDQQRCRAAGMDAWLRKPLMLQQLRKVLLYWLPGPGALPPVRKPTPPGVAWPTRADLVQTFGSQSAVDRMLASLLVAAREDSALLEHARLTCNTAMTAERLHRLVGSLAFLGGVGLEARGVELIEQVQAHGVMSVRAELEVFQADLQAYITYLNSL